MPKIAALRIPGEAVPRLRAFADLSPEASAEVLAALGEASPTVSSHTLSVSVTTALPHFSATDSDELISILFNLWAAGSSHNWELSDVAETIAASDDLGLSEANQSSFAERLYAALTSPGIADAAKAADIATEYDAIFHTARCFTDIRPVFGDKVESGLTGAVVRHNLKFDYFTVGEVRSLTIALSDGDVDRLSAILRRATAKSLEVHKFLNDAAVRTFELGAGQEKRDAGEE